MERLLVEDHIKINSVCRRMKRNKVSYGVLVEHWRPFGFNLDVHDSRIDLVERKLLDRRILGEELPREILKCWKVEQGKIANLKTIYDALIETNVKDLAENIQDDFSQGKITLQEPDTRAASPSRVEPIVHIHIHPKKQSAWKFVKNFVLDKLRKRGFVRSKTSVPLPIHDFRQNKVYWIPDSSSLHLAANKGLYSVFMQLLQEQDDVSNFKYLWHASVSDSSDDNDSVLENKLKIIEELARKNPACLEERFEDRTPILQTGVHLKLLKALVSKGADINASSEEHGTVLHGVDNESNFHSTLEWALSQGFEHINFRASRNGLAPILHAIRIFNQIQNDSLELFHKSGADFNTTDSSGYSTLFHALWNSRSQDFIEYVINYGADVNHCKAGPDQINVAHAVLRYAEEWDAKDVLSKLQLVVSQGFDLISQKDAKGKSAVDYAIESGNIHPDILDFVVKTEATPLVDEEIDSFLFKKIREGASAKTIGTILDAGANVNHINDDFTTAHAVIEALNQGMLNYKKALEILELLVAKGFDKINHKSDIKMCSYPELTGVTPLFYALYVDLLDENLLQFFYANEADFNIFFKAEELYRKYEMPVLFFALCKKLKKSLIEKMIDYGSNVHARAKRICEYNEDVYMNVCHLMISLASKCMYRYSCQEVISIFEFLASKGLDFNLLNERGHDKCVTTVHLAMSNKNLLWDECDYVKMMEYLHKKGAHFNCTDISGKTIAYSAIENRFGLKSLQKIVDCGGDLSARGDYILNAIEFARGVGVDLSSIRT